MQRSTAQEKKYNDDCAELSVEGWPKKKFHHIGMT